MTQYRVQHWFAPGGASPFDRGLRSMLIIALLAAAALYLLLGFIYLTAKPYLRSSPAVLENLRQLILGLPQLEPLALLKWAIILVAFYLITDALRAAVRRRRRPRK